MDYSRKLIVTKKEQELEFVNFEEVNNALDKHENLWIDVVLNKKILGMFKLSRKGFKITHNCSMEDKSSFYLIQETLIEFLKRFKSVPSLDIAS